MNPGAPFSDFILLRELGRGGTAVVWEAYDKVTDEIVALKILDALSPAEVDRDRFVREAELLQIVRGHPGFVELKRCAPGSNWRDSKPLWMTMNLCDGNFHQLVTRNRRWSVDDAARSVRDICLSVDYLHRQDPPIIHRDLKPGNVLYSRGRGLMIADLGLSKPRGHAGPTRTRDYCGTPGFMAPELYIHGLKNAGVSVDIFALGGILFFALTHRSPLRGRYSVEWMWYICGNDPLDKPSTLNDQVPPELDTICLRAMDRDPARRYQSVRDMAYDLSAYLDGGPLRFTTVNLARTRY